MMILYNRRTNYILLQIMKSEIMRISNELQAQKEKIKENTEKIKVNKTLPYLVSNVVEVRKLLLVYNGAYGIHLICLCSHQQQNKSTNTLTI